MRLDGFLPSRHGFSFRNRPSSGGELFGLGTPVDAAFGLSAGMAWLALDRYLAGRPIGAAAEAPACDDALHAELVMRQSAALARCGWTMLRDWQRLPERGKPWRPGSAELTHAQWRQLRRSLDAGVPVMLFLVLAGGRHADPSTNQAVLAYDYEIDRRTGRVSVRVYDPARPGNDGVRLVFGLSRFRPLEARLAVQTPVRGFFCVPYDRPFPATLGLSDAGALDGHRAASVFALQGTDRADGVVELLARGGAARDTGGSADDDGGASLLRIHRRRSGRWTAERIEARGAEDRTIDDATMLGRNSMIARTSAGELFEFRRRPGFGWRARSMTGRGAEHRPALLQDHSGTSLFACVAGRLMHYRRSRTGAWNAQHIAAGALARTSCQGTPAAARLGRGSLHVLTRTNTGELMHARWRGKAGWAAENVTARAGDRDRFLVCDDPILLADTRAGRLSAIARSQTGAVLLFRWSARSGWRAQDLTAATGDACRADSALSAALDDDGTVHVVARTDDRGLLHIWCGRDGAAGGQVLTRTRSTIGAAGHIDGAPRIVTAPAGALHVFARAGTGLLLYRWAHGADWSVENVSRERTGPNASHDPFVTVADHAVHVAAVDDGGRVNHVCLTAGGPGSSAGVRLRVPTWVADVAALPITVAAVFGELVGAPARMLARRRDVAPARLDDHEPWAGEVDAGDTAGSKARPVVRMASTAARPRPMPGGVDLPHRAGAVSDATDVAADVEPDAVEDFAQDAAADISQDIVLDAMGDAASDAPLDLTAMLSPSMLPDVPVPDDPVPAADADDAQDADVPTLTPEIERTASPEPEPLFDVDEWIMQDVDEPAASAATNGAAESDDPAPAQSGEDDWNLPAADLAAASAADDDWNLPAAAAASAADDDWNLPAAAEPAAASIADDDRDVPTAEPAPSVEEPWMDAPASSTSDEDWSLPPIEPAASSASDDDWSLPAVEPAAQAASADDWSLPAVEPAAASASDDDWSLPPIEPAPAGDDWNAPQPTQPPMATVPDDWSLPPLEPSQSTDDSADAASPRRWQNPALEGLPLLDDDVPPQPQPPVPNETPAPKPPARRAAKKKRASSAEELERVMALAEKNRLELLEPD